MLARRIREGRLPPASIGQTSVGQCRKWSPTAATAVRSDDRNEYADNRSHRPLPPHCLVPDLICQPDARADNDQSEQLRGRFPTDRSAVNHVGKSEKGQKRSPICSRRTRQPRSARLVPQFVRYSWRLLQKKQVLDPLVEASGHHQDQQGRGAYCPVSIELTVCRVTPASTASCSWERIF